MEATIVNYKSGKRTQDTKRMVLQPKDSKTKEDAEKFVGKKVEWTTPSGKKLSGEIRKAHGINGAVIAAFQAGLPGQALGTKVQIL
ncbi:MAG: 50S ribosomal protein L35ae [Candidatus Altiarchaeota archaeon]|nr:50S ribosomal protein L35ae [Candidatus Altiarchaeota archaeon]